MATQTLDLWDLVLGKPQIDPADLAESVCLQAGDEALDYRTRLLIRDSVQALRSFWGPVRFDQWLAECPNAAQVTEITEEEFEEVGFPTIRRRLMDKTRPEHVSGYLQELGRALQQETTVHVGEAIAVILPGYLSRHTDEVDIIDGVPAALRSKHALLDTLAQRYGLELGQVQSHHYPSGWENRVHSTGPFGRLRVFLLDVYDVFLSKLFSDREKDRDDLRVLLPQLDKQVIARKLKDHARGLLAGAGMRERAENNWQILFGEPLPQ